MVDSKSRRKGGNASKKKVKKAPTATDGGDKTADVKTKHRGKRTFQKGGNRPSQKAQRPPKFGFEEVKTATAAEQETSGGSVATTSEVTTPTVNSLKKRLLTPASTSADAATKRPRSKRVSFASALEMGPGSPTPETPTLKSILKRKNGEDKQKPAAPKKVKPDEKENADATMEENEEPKTRKKSGVKVPVTKQQKEELLKMSHKDRKAMLKKIKEKRKPYHEIAVSAKKLWEKVRSGKTKEAERETYIEELASVVRGKAKQLIYAHDTVRVIQCLISLNRPAIRASLFSELKDEVVRMAKSKYARFFVQKMLKSGTSEERGRLIDAMKGHCVALLRHNFGCESIEYAYNHVANAKQRSDIISEFYGTAVSPKTGFSCDEPLSLKLIASAYPEKLNSVLTELKEHIVAFATKESLKYSLAHRLLSEYLEFAVQEDRADVIEVVKDRLVEMVHTKDGCSSFCYSLWFGNVKQRKAIVKSFKTFVVKAACEKYGSLCLMAVFDTVDDTVLVVNTIVKELLKSVKELMHDQHGVKVMAYLATPRDPHFLQKDPRDFLAVGDSNQFSKKEPKIRRAELWAPVAKPLCLYISENVQEMIFDKRYAIFLLGILDVKDDEPESDKITMEDRKVIYGFVAQLAGEEFIPMNIEGRLHVVEHPTAHFVLGHLLTADCYLVGRRPSVTLSGILAAAVPQQNLDSWIGCSRGCHVLAKMFESGDASAMEAVKKTVTTTAKLLRKKRNSSKGAAVLLKIVKRPPVKAPVSDHTDVVRSKLDHLQVR